MRTLFGQYLPGSSRAAILVMLYQGLRMTIELPSEIETQLKEAAQALGVSVGQYVESNVAETSLRRAQVSECSGVCSALGRRGW